MNVEAVAMIIQAIWPILASLGFLSFAAIVYCMKLGWRMTQLEREHDQTKNSHKEIQTTIWTKLETLQSSVGQVFQALGRLEGKIDGQDQHRS